MPVVQHADAAGMTRAAGGPGDVSRPRSDHVGDPAYLQYDVGQRHLGQLNVLQDLFLTWRTHATTPAKFSDFALHRTT